MTGPSVRLTFSAVDWVILGLYVVFLGVVGFRGRNLAPDEFLIAGRRLGVVTFVATLVATWYGAVLGAGEFVYTTGIVAWISNGVPYYLFGIVFAVFLAPRVRRAAISLYTIPDKLAIEYDRKTAVLGAALCFIYACPAQYVLMAGVLLEAMSGLPRLTALIVAALFSVAYVGRGGFLADVRVNTVQFLLMFAGFIVAAYACLSRFGGPAFITRPGALPAVYLHPLGEFSPAWVAVWFFIALTTFADPGFHQRCYAARTPRVAVAGILIAVVFWFSFDALTTTTGLFARVLQPHLTDPVMAFPALAERVMPPGVKGLFVLGMLAPIMASTVSYTFIGSVTIGRDFIWRLRSTAPASAEAEGIASVPAYTRCGLVVTSVLAVAIAWIVPSVVQQWYLFGSIFVPGMLFPILGAYSERWKASAENGFLSMAAGCGLSLLWILWGARSGRYDEAMTPGGIPPMYPGLALSALTYLVGIVRRRHARR